MKKISDSELRQWIDESGHHHDHHHHHHDDDFHDYTKAVNEYRKTFPDKQQVIEQTPDPAVREMLLHMQKLGIEYHDCHCVGTIIHMAIDGVYAGHIVISDIIKPHSAEAIARLKKSGVSKTVMLTGDARRVAEQVAGELGVDEVRSELLPGDKVAEVEKLLAEKAPKDNLAFVGDGINDAPVLTRADIGIAMGAMGSDAAIEAADVVLMDDDPLKIAKAIRISRKCIGIVRQNIVFSLIVKFACLALTAAGITNMWAAIFADVGVMILAVLNAIRALRVHNL